MPELPEVESFRRMLMHLVSTTAPLTLELVSESPPKTFLSQENVDYINQNHCLVHDIQRRGKLIRMQLVVRGSDSSKSISEENEEKWFLYIHMGMTGRITCSNKAPTWGHFSSSSSPSTTDDEHSPSPRKKTNNKNKNEDAFLYPPRYTHVRFRTGDDVDACFSDPRKFGKAYLVHADLDDELESLAPDGLTEFNDSSPLIGLSTGIKAVLLDQKRVVSGVGNWVADEVLYQCHIHPDQTHLTAVQASNIQKRLRHILQVAVDCLVDSSTGEYPADWLFHYRWAKKKSGAKDAQGRSIQFITSGGRTTALVATIQRKRAQQPERNKRATNTSGAKSRKQGSKGAGPRKTTSAINSTAPLTDVETPALADDGDSALSNDNPLAPIELLSSKQEGKCNVAPRKRKTRSSASSSSEHAPRAKHGRLNIK